MTSPSPTAIPLRRPTRRRLARAWKLLLCALLVFGLVPGADELIESAAHLLHDGHLPHSATHDRVAAAEGCDDAGAEHGCTPLAHHCKCCASATALPPRVPSFDLPVRLAPEAKYGAVSERGPPKVGVKPSLPPPIA